MNKFLPFSIKRNASLSPRGGSGKLSSRLSQYSHMLRYAGFLAVFIALFVFVNVQANATAVTPNVLVRFDNMKAATAEKTGLICYEPTGADTTTTVTLNLPTGFTNGDTTTTNWTTSTTNIPATLDGVTTQGWAITSTHASAATSGTLAFAYSSGAVASGKDNCFTFSDSGAGITNPSAANNLAGTLVTSGGAPATTVNYATSIITGGNQITVTGSVSSQFSFTLSANAYTLGSLNLLTAGTDPTLGTAITGTVSTNAANGWEAWIFSLNGGLLSSSAGYTIKNAQAAGSGAQAYSAGSNFFTCSHQAVGECYGLFATAGGGSTIDGAYTHGSEVSGTYSAGTLDTKYEPIATDTTAASSDTFVMTLLAGVLGTTPSAGDYADTITVTAAGDF